MIETREQACMILGVRASASEEEIKTAYKYMVKHLHPDAEVYEDPELYQQVVEAYDFLRRNPKTGPKQPEQAPQAVSNPPRIIGKPNTMGQKRREQEAFDRWYQKRQEEKKEAFERRLQIEQDNRLYQQKQEKDYQKAMEDINNIILVETIKKLIHQNNGEEK